jgi:hypothetical protein
MIDAEYDMNQKQRDTQCNDNCSRGSSQNQNTAKEKGEEREYFMQNT